MSTAHLLRPQFKLALPLKILFNVGACLDIPTGRYAKGKYGEHILVGGIGTALGIVGHGNNFKSALLNYCFGQMLVRIPGFTVTSYDTEINIVEDRIMSCVAKLPDWKGEMYFETGRWQVTDSTMHLGDEYFDILKEFMAMKIKEQKRLMRETPFMDRDGKSLIKIIQPTGGTVDSLSEFKTADIVKMTEDNTLGDSGGNTIFMRQGIQKKRFITELPNLLGASSHFLGMAGHIGDKVDMGNAMNPKVQGLQHLKVGKIKGIPDAFTFLTNHCLHNYGASILKNDGTGAPEFPRNSEENKAKGSLDLNVVRSRMLRSKTGTSGWTVELVVSQSEGILPALTEYYNIKTRKNYGIGGSPQGGLYLELYPELKFMRTTVRGLLERDVRFSRAMNITSELAQINEHWSDTHTYYLEPAALYQRLKELGYDWNRLLDTRGWWTLDNDDPKGSESDYPFLSTRDLLEMAHRRYVPYWMKDEEVPTSCKKIPRVKGKFIPQPTYSVKAENTYDVLEDVTPVA